MNKINFIKLLVLFPIAFLSSCKSQHRIKNVPFINNNNKCILLKLEHILDYEKVMVKYENIYSDKVILVDKVIINKETYKTILDIKKTNKYLWLIKEKDEYKKKDSTLIFCIDSNLSVESEVNLNDCEITQIKTTFSENGSPYNTTYRKIKLK